jgi:hypothetical protein
VESYRNALGEVRQRTVLSVGFVDCLTAEQLNAINLDPEIIEKYNGFDSGTYPMQQSYSFGLNLTF